MINYNSYKGKILVSLPAISDDIFSRTVILIVEDNEEGTVGFILNKPLEFNINELINNLDSHGNVCEGGPVYKNNIYYIHNRPDLISECKQVKNDYYWAGEFEEVRGAINSNQISKDEIRFFLGYSGWDKGQLANEIKNNAWLVMEDSFDILANWNVNLWKRQLTKLGGENLLWVNAPKDPMLN